MTNLYLGLVLAVISYGLIWLFDSKGSSNISTLYSIFIPAIASILFGLVAKSRQIKVSALFFVGFPILTIVATIVLGTMVFYVGMGNYGLAGSRSSITPGYGVLTGIYWGLFSLVISLNCSSSKSALFHLLTAAAAGIAGFSAGLFLDLNYPKFMFGICFLATGFGLDIPYILNKLKQINHGQYVNKRENNR